MKREYGKLKRKMLGHVAVIAVVGLALVGLFLLLFLSYTPTMPDEFTLYEGPEGDLVMSAEQLQAMADIIDHQRYAYLLTIGVLVVLLAMFYYAMTRLIRYFRITRAGVGKLLEDTADPIELPPEMDFMQSELNGVRGELGRRQREAQEAVRRKDELVAYLAHDIRTPLTTVIGYLNLMTEQPAMAPERRAEYLGTTLESAKRLEVLVNEFFEITRFNAQGIRLDVRAFDLAFLLRQLADAFYPILSPQGKRIEIDVPAQLKIMGDADKLSRVFRNIIKNASVFSDEDSVIWVEARTIGAEAEVVIRDTGAPIPSGELEAIFDKFYRLDSARSAKTGGAGLGLAIAKEIVQAHGGQVSADCAGRDTVFTVTLPVGQPG